MIMRSLWASGVAVPTAEKAGVVRPDIPAFDATARLPLARVFRRAHRDAEEPRDKLIVDAFASIYPEGREIASLGAANDSN
jgi:hypothetical protein